MGGAATAAALVAVVVGAKEWEKRTADGESEDEEEKKMIDDEGEDEEEKKMIDDEGEDATAPTAPPSYFSGVEATRPRPPHEGGGGGGGGVAIRDE